MLVKRCINVQIDNGHSQTIRVLLYCKEEGKLVCIGIGKTKCGGRHGPNTFRAVPPGSHFLFGLLISDNFTVPLQWVGLDHTFFWGVRKGSPLRSGGKPNVEKVDKKIISGQKPGQGTAIPAREREKTTFVMHRMIRGQRRIRGAGKVWLNHRKCPSILNRCLVGPFFGPPWLPLRNFHVRWPLVSGAQWKITN